MLLLLILIPIAGAALALAIPWNRLRPWVLPPVALAHLAMVICNLHAAPAAGGWLVLDPVARLVLLLVSVLFLICSIYCVGYLHYRRELSNRIFVPCLMSFLATTTLVTCSHHLGLMWVAMEATTLSTAPLIYFNRTPRSIEATWKYLLVGSVGIAIALLGSFFLAYSSLGAGGEPSLLLEQLVQRAPLLDKSWLQAAFVLLLVGYGTKMGLAPMHTWKPDAYGEAPGVVGALLAGGVTNCAFLSILRIYHICHAAGETGYETRLLIGIGLLSMIVAAIFMVGQRDFKRMLAYSSVEHMGILVLGVGIGGPALFGSLLHMLNNGLTKGVLFLCAGNIHRAYGAKTTDEVRGAMRFLPFSGTLFLLGFFAITGSPPFGPFVSEFTILNGAFHEHHFLAGASFLFLLLVIFIGMGRTVLTVVQGRPLPGTVRSNYREGILTGLPILMSMALVLMMGLHIPAPINAMLHEAAHFLENRP
jgi:hydrogenase-4 component F